MASWEIYIITKKIYISVYLETGGMTPAATFTITTNNVANNDRMWNVSKQDSKPFQSLFWLILKINLEFLDQSSPNSMPY